MQPEGSRANHEHQCRKREGVATPSAPARGGSAGRQRMTERRVRAFVESLRRNRRPKRFDAKPADVDEMRAAIELASGRPGATLPSSEFVNDLHRRLADQLDNASMQAEPAPARP